MSINLLELLKGQIGSQVIKQASSLLGEKEETTQSAMDSILPSMLGGLMSKASTKDGASALFNMLGQTNKEQGGMLDDIMGMMSGGNETDSLMKSGGSMLSGLFGDKLGGLVSLISGNSGLGAGSTSSLMSMAAPMIMGFLGKTQNSMGLDMGGLASMLMGQKDHIQDALPQGFADTLGIGSLDNVVDSAKGNLGGMLSGLGGSVLSSATETVGAAANLGKSTISKTTETVSSTVSGAANVAEDAAATGISWMKWLFPLLLLLGALFFLRQGCSSADDTLGSAIETTKDGVSSVAGAASDAAGAAVDKAGDAAGAAANVVKEGVSQVKLAGGEAIDFVKGSFGDKFASFITSGGKDLNTHFTFDNVNFKSGSAVLMTTPNPELDNLIKVLKAYPSVNIRLEGHTDNQGDAAKNKTLSKNRADAVKAYLTKGGIKAERLATAGFGAEKPVAKNDTEEGRLKNRRTDVVITKR